MPLFNKEHQKARQEARQLRKQLKVEGKQNTRADRIANRGQLFSQVGGIVNSLTGGSAQNSSVTSDNRNLAVAQNPDGSTDIMSTLKNNLPILAIVGVVIYFMMNKKKGRGRR